ncbi:MAG: MTH1187 family thiamine-binding protein [Betaproteobacteria bacterium]
MVLLEFSIAPGGQGESLSGFVARVLDIVDQSGLVYQLTPMGTILEGEWDEVMAVVTACFKHLQADCKRIGVQIKVDYRDAPAGRLLAKTGAVERKLGRKLRT